MSFYVNILKQYKLGLIICPILVLMVVMSESLQPSFIAQIIDNGIAQKNSQVVIYYGLQMIGVAIVGLAANLANVYFSSRVAIGFSTDLRHKIFEKIQTLSFAEIDTLGTPSLITRLTSDVTKLQTLMLMLLRLLLRAPLMIIIALFFVWYIAPQLLWIVALSIPILGVALYVILNKGFPLFMAVQERVDNLNAVIRENLINIRIVKSFVREDFEKKKFSLSAVSLQDKTIRASNMAVTIFPMMQLVMNVSVVLILWFGGVEVVHQNLKIGELVSVVNYLIQILMSLMMLSAVFVMYVRASASSKRIQDVLSTTSTLTNTAIAKTNSFEITHGQIELSNVSFRYPNSENDVLKNISLTIRGGEHVAILGATGAGKSSLLHLIARLYDISEGNLLIDNRSIKDYLISRLHQKLRIVLQKNELFAGSIKQNIAQSDPLASQQEIERVAKLAEAHSFIIETEQGYDTLLGRDGVNLSGGQKQRICMARALLGNPSILLLDDSTSALDTLTERQIIKNLRQQTQTTIVMVTQKVTNIHLADKIVVMDDGQIIACGRHDQLMNTSSVYREIYQSQQPTTT